MAEHHDDVRRTLLFEPRGHADMYGAVLTPPVTPGADFGVLFLTNEGYSTMCGHGVIALTTALLEIGMAARVRAADGRRLRLTGRVSSGPRAEVDGGRVTSVSFRNVPAFRYAQGLAIDDERRPGARGRRLWRRLLCPGRCQRSRRRGRPEQTPRLTQLGMEVKRAVEREIEVVHPDEPELRGIYGTIISAPPRSLEADGRNITIYAEGAVDRSPCGTGTSAKLACLYADGASAWASRTSTRA